MENNAVNSNEKVMPPKRLLTVKETAVILGVSVRTIYNNIAPKSKGSFCIKPIRVGRLVKFRMADIDDFLNP